LSDAAHAERSDPKGENVSGPVPPHGDRLQFEMLLSNLVSVDITGRKQAEEALKDSEAKYRQLHESMMDAEFFDLAEPVLQLLFHPPALSDVAHHGPHDNGCACFIPEEEGAKFHRKDLRFVEGQTRVKTGCLDCAVYETRDQKHSILYVEQWQSREGLNRHIRSDHYLCILAAIELSSERPEISFHEASDTY